MGGEWAAGMPLVLEHYPEERRGFVLGVLPGRVFVGSHPRRRRVFQFGAPYFELNDVPVWRGLMWTGILPALLVLVDSSAGAGESALAGRGAPARRRAPRRGDHSLAPMCSARQSCSPQCSSRISRCRTGYPRSCGGRSLTTAGPFSSRLNVGGIIGAAFWGRLAGSRYGARRAIATGAVLFARFVAAVPAGRRAVDDWAGAFAIGLTGAGIIGVMPTYVGNHFDTASRATGWGLAYHAAAAWWRDLASTDWEHEGRRMGSRHGHDGRAVGIATALALALLSFRGSK
jgi:hypothetical protein